MQQHGGVRTTVLVRQTFQHELLGVAAMQKLAFFFTVLVSCEHDPRFPRRAVPLRLRASSPVAVISGYSRFYRLAKLADIL